MRSPAAGTKSSSKQYEAQIFLSIKINLFHKTLQASLQSTKLAFQSGSGFRARLGCFSPKYCGPCLALFNSQYLFSFSETSLIHRNRMKKCHLVGLGPNKIHILYQTLTEISVVSEFKSYLTLRQTSRWILC